MALTYKQLLLCCAGLGIAGATLPAHADPCGMVPPLVMPVDQVAIERVGAQKTFVAHYKGVETMVLRPGFKGKIDEFGMLIPFPSAPAIRKVDEDIFAHIGAAIDPPEVVARVYNERDFDDDEMSADSAGATASVSDKKDGEKRLRYDTVRVINREAVGMYDVAVLEAGSTRALKRWMSSNGFRYPKGMEPVTEDYVNARWVFVAIKTQVGKKDGVNPRPGMRKTNSKLPKGSTFTGNVQAMGFRFKSKDLVVPMRLSAFNAGKLRNIVYVLSDQPSMIERIPSRYVVRQVTGKQLYRNLTSPLPLRVIGGTYQQLQPHQKQQLKQTRRSEPHLGEAKNLFASDLLAIRSGKLANSFEESEKQLLAIGERLELRGNQLDKLHGTELAIKKKRAVVKALRDVKKLSLTVIDGEFKRETIASANLSFGKYAMPQRRNNKKSYDATKAGPGFVNTQGKVYYSSIDSLDRIQRMQKLRKDAGPDTHWMWGGGLGLGLFLLLGVLVTRRRLSESHESTY